MVEVFRLQRRLHEDRAATIYVNDVPPNSPDFAAVQWWGTAGGLHGLAPLPTGSRLGKQIQGQHSEGWLNHDVGLGRVLDAKLASRWIELGRELGLPVDSLPKVNGRSTRGEWIRAAFQAFRTSD